MSQDWMIDVLKDLKAFATQNGLVALAEQLDDSLMIAAAEVKQKSLDDHGLSGSSNKTPVGLGELTTGENL